MALESRPGDMKRIDTPELAQAYIDERIAMLREQIGDRKVLLALSGGVDSSVVAALLIRAIGKQLTCVHVNHGLLGKEFIEVFAEEARKLDGISFLGQGTIWPDILESEGGIKAHHNAGGLPEDLRFELVEPARILFKDEVRMVGRALGLPAGMVERQPFPGPGLGVRCPGAITRERLEAVREADAILREEFAAAGLAGKVWQYFTVVPDFRSTGIRDGKRTFEWPVIIRAINTTDAMSATVEEIPFALMQKLVSRITSEVKGVNRVLYDFTPKPCATIEYE